MADVSYCGNCGAGLQAKNPAACVKCGANPAKAARNCPFCGAKLASENADVCVKCGAALRGIGKEPMFPLLVAIVGFVLIGTPTIGYLFLNNARKALAYTLVIWGSGALIFMGYMFGAVLTAGIGGLVCMPFLLVPLIMGLAVVYDIYLMADRRKAVLPEL